MYKIIFDSDALIKLIKAKIPQKIFGNFKGFITCEVYEESVVRGKMAFFEDAFTIESLVKENLIKKIKAKKTPETQKILSYENLGMGEKSTLHLYHDIKADAICSDDGKFLRFLDRNDVNFIMPADLILRLKETKLLSKEDAIKVMDGLRPYIKEHIYLQFKEQIGEKK